MAAPPRRAAGWAIRLIREAQGIRPGAFATRIGISSAYLSNIEAGRRHPGDELSHVIADRLGVDLATLTGQKPIIGAVRLALNITTAEFAAYLGVDVDDLHRIEAGAQTPSATVLNRAATRLGVRAADLRHPRVEQRAAS